MAFHAFECLPLCLSVRVRTAQCWELIVLIPFRPLHLISHKAPTLTVILHIPPSDSPRKGPSGFLGPLAFRIKTRDPILYLHNLA